MIYIYYNYLVALQLILIGVHLLLKLFRYLIKFILLLIIKLFGM